MGWAKFEAIFLRGDQGSEAAQSQNPRPANPSVDMHDGILALGNIISIVATVNGCQAISVAMGVHDG
jgi:hypothetical protein